MEHGRRVDTVLGKLIQAGLKLKPSKCTFLQTDVLFLGYIVGKDGVKTNPELVEKMVQWPEQQNVRQVQQFLGLVNYYRKFILQHSEIVAPMVELTKKDKSFIWTEKAQRAFDKIKTAMCAPPILALPQPTGEYILDTDASNVGVGAVLSQVQEGKEKVIAYGSKTLTREQRNYCVTRHELLAVIVFLQQFRHYILGREFIVRSDHSSLRWLFSFKEPQGQLARWLEYVSQYTF